MEASAFRLEVGPTASPTSPSTRRASKVNIFSRATLAELDALITELAEAQRTSGCLLLRSAKPDIFIAGADVEEIAGSPIRPSRRPAHAYGHRLFAAWEALPFPTVAAIRGTCLGGGTELALASTVSSPATGGDLRIGLPEVQLGIVPGWGGCVRLPRLIGLVRRSS
jgi:3-hydroxyacyl-CoA dehydrogenase / enoyl-CoA hydratase / 3-hydroxybutyryl-CoA epimerase